jgi:hypothetical protein
LRFGGKTRAGHQQAVAEPGGLLREITPKKPRRARWRRLVWHLLVLIFVVLWIGAVVYPDPRPLVTSIERLQHPPVDAAAVSSIAATLPNNQKAIEDFSLDYVTYTPAWTVYGLPWYFPNVQEVLRDHAGDCQARALLAASIFEAKGMPYTLRYSFDHVWVDYPGKVAADMEDPSTSFVADSGRGWLAKLPTRIPLWSIIKVRVDYHWTPMPLLQKIIILLGSALIIGWGEREGFARLASRIVRWPLQKKATV